LWERPEDLERLQEILDHSIAAARSPMLHHIFRPDRALTAEQVVSLFPDRRVGVLGTVNANGEPRVAPVDILFVRGRFQASSRESAGRIKHLRRNPAASLTFFEGDDLAVIAHGTAELVGPGEAGWSEADEACRAVYESSASDWAPDAVYIWLQPTTMFAFARDPSRVAATSSGSSGS
jgi:nitroimidazol reductase NimA-like FMN-containing flavoprotein (pyridoxamine 5'-phosphate oxidase superfamily)